MSSQQTQVILSQFAMSQTALQMKAGSVAYQNIQDKCVFFVFL